MGTALLYSSRMLVNCQNRLQGFMHLSKALRPQRRRVSKAASPGREAGAARRMLRARAPQQRAQRSRGRTGRAQLE